MLKLSSGNKVYYNGEEYVIRRILKDMVNVLIIHSKTNQIEQVPIVELALPPENEKILIDEVKPLDLLSERDREKAEYRFNIIEPLINKFRGDRAKLLEIASQSGIGRSTLYKWIAAYDSTGNIGSLVDKEGRGGKGKMRLDKETDKIIEKVIDEKYKRHAKSFQSIYHTIVEKCKENNLVIPHQNTVRNRIYQLSEYEKVKKIKGPKAAEEMYEPKTGHLEGVDYPLSMAQIDHTLLDIMLVDETNRELLGRPWLTMVVDVYSRVPLGFYLSFDPPGTYGTGRAIAHAIMPKERFMASIGVSGEWPCWGKMHAIHCDNAKEFRGTMLVQSCKDYGITLMFRPVKRPNYGGHIERLMGTFNKEIHDLSGSTNSNKEIRQRFPPEKLASLTLHELEKWLTIFITEVYLKRIHKGIERPPLDMWKEGIFGTAEKGGIGIPERFTDESKMLLDFLPYTERTIQRTGIRIDNIRYYGDVLSKWINSLESSSKRKRKFKFKQDPRDISKLFFLDPEAKQYFEIPYLNLGQPKMSKWEYNKVISKIKENLQAVDEEAIFEGYKKMRLVEETAKKETRMAKKRNERERKMEREQKLNAIENKTQNLHAFSDDNIKPFDE